MKPAMDRGILAEIGRKLADLERSMENREEYSGRPLALELSREIARSIEKWTGENLPELLPLDNVESLGRVLGEVHRRISGAKEVRVTAGPRSITIDVVGCRDFDSCPMREQGSSYVGCPTDMVVAAILQSAMETPVRVRVDGGQQYCRQVFSPAWLVDLLKDLDRLGAEGLVVTCSERVLFTHFPTQAHAVALSETLLTNEEQPVGDQGRIVRHMEHHNTRLMLLNYGRVFVSVCLRHEADEEAIADEVAKAIERELAGASEPATSGSP